MNRQSTLKKKGKAPAIRITALFLSFVACWTVSSWQTALAGDFDVNGVMTDPQGSGGAGYSSSPTDVYSSVRLSDSAPTGQGPEAMAKELTPDYTSNQQFSRNDVPFAGAPVTTTPVGTGSGVSQLDKVFGGGVGNLPPTRLDSFVAQAGGNAELIYGDEGIMDIPPLFGFTEMSRINAGINSGGLTTGHQDGSLPEAWGYPQ